MGTPGRDLPSPPQFHRAQLLWEQRYGHLPKFLQFVEQNWFKSSSPSSPCRLEVSEATRTQGWEAEAGAPRVTAGGGAPQACPKMGMVEGLASAFMDLLEEASWAGRRACTACAAAAAAGPQQGVL